MANQRIIAAVLALVVASLTALPARADDSQSEQRVEVERERRRDRRLTSFMLVTLYGVSVFGLSMASWGARDIYRANHRTCVEEECPIDAPWVRGVVSLVGAAGVVALITGAVITRRTLVDARRARAAGLLTLEPSVSKRFAGLNARVSW